MTNNLRIAMVIFSLMIVFIVLWALKKDKMPVKYSIIWFAAALMILILAVFPEIFMYMAKLLGFNMMSNMVMAVFIGMLLIITMVLTMIVSKQKKQITLLIQEVSILKQDK